MTSIAGNSALEMLYTKAAIVPHFTSNSVYYFILYVMIMINSTPEPERGEHSLSL